MCALAACRPILYEMNRQLFNNGNGNEEFANLPRKINVCISPSRDDFPHTQVWKLSFLPAMLVQSGICLLSSLCPCELPLNSVLSKHAYEGQRMHWAHSCAV